jgi:hypothetical protein
MVCAFLFRISGLNPSSICCSGFCSGVRRRPTADRVRGAGPTHMIDAPSSRDPAATPGGAAGDPADVACQACNKRSGAATMLLCDRCDDRGYHTRCLVPALPGVPDGDWVCPGCAPLPAPPVPSLPAAAPSRRRPWATAYNDVVACQCVIDEQHGAASMLLCDGCNQGVHCSALACMRRQRLPAGDWKCSACPLLKMLLPGLATLYPASRLGPTVPADCTSTMRGSTAALCEFRAAVLCVICGSDGYCKEPCTSVGCGGCTSSSDCCDALACQSGSCASPPVPSPATPPRAPAPARHPSPSKPPAQPPASSPPPPRNP